MDTPGKLGDGTFPYFSYPEIEVNPVYIYA
jgi:hypothetical protein